MRKHILSGLFLATCITNTSFISTASAEAVDALTHANNFKTIKIQSIYGQSGTLTTPNARHYQTGTISAHIGTLDPYIHYSFGTQLLDGLHAQLRQSAEISSAKDDADRLFPGLDLKLRLTKEGRYRPELSLGLISAIGHKRMAGEYIAASKRIDNFDLTAGLGWGRFGTAAHFDNPFSAFGSHFDTQRNLDGEDANNPDDWFTGKNIGLFASAVWHSPIEGLSLSADYGADRYEAEKFAINGFDAPSPFSYGLSYAPTEWANFSIGMNGTEKVMGHLNFSTPIQNIKTRSAKRDDKAPLPDRLIQRLTGNKEISLIGKETPDSFITAPEYNKNEKTVQLETAGQHETLPYIIGKTAQRITDTSYAELNSVEMRPMRYGLKGAKVKILTRDLHAATEDHLGSAEEIWLNAAIKPEKFKAKKLPTEYRKSRNKFWGFTLENHVSLNEEDNGTLTRNALLVSRRIPLSRNFLSINRARLNLFNNLEGLKYLRQTDSKNIRGNIEDFASNGLSFDQAALVYNGTSLNNLYHSVSLGYLEEMYFGGGAEILYRPYNKTWAIGAEVYDVIKRNPFTAGASGFEDSTATITGHVNAYYEVPDTGTTLNFSAGRYLAKDYGATFSIAQQFKNGAAINGFVTGTNRQDIDVFGGTTHLYGGLNFTMPLGSLSFLPNGSELTLKTSPLGRNAAQKLDKPFNLYQETEQLSKRHLIQNWSDIVK